MKVTTHESHIIMQTLATNTDWEKISTNVLKQITDDPEKSGKLFYDFLKTFDISPLINFNIITVKRDSDFNPEEFLGNGWKTLKHYNESLNILNFEIKNIRLENVSDANVVGVNGYSRMKQLIQKKYILLDSYFFLTFWCNQNLIPEFWKEKINGKTRFICFDGSVFISPKGDEYTMYLYWAGGEWNFRQHRLNEQAEENVLSAVLVT